MVGYNSYGVMGVLFDIMCCFVLITSIVITTESAPGNGNGSIADEILPYSGDGSGEGSISDEILVMTITETNARQFRLSMDNRRDEKLYHISYSISGKGNTVKGNSLWQLLVYGSTSADVSGEKLNPTAETFNSCQASIKFTPTQTVHFGHVYFNYNTREENCDNMTFICFELSKGLDSTVDFEFRVDPEDAVLSCIPVVCDSGIIKTEPSTVTADVIGMKQVGSPEINLSWDSFQISEKIHSFRIFYNSGNQINFNKVHSIEVSGMENTTIISPMSPNTLYTIRVEAYTEKPRIVKVGEVQVMTSEENVNVKEVTSSRITLSWKSFELICENVEHFRVFYSSGERLDFNAVNSIEVNGTENATIISPLSPSTLYTVRIEAYTDEDRVVIVGELQVLTTSDPTSSNMSSVIGAVGGSILVLIIAIVVVIFGIKRYGRKTAQKPPETRKMTKRKKTNVYNADDQYQVPRL